MSGTAIIRVSECGECAKPRVTSSTIDYASDYFGDVDVFVDDLLAGTIEIEFIDETTARYRATVHSRWAYDFAYDRVFTFNSESDTGREDALASARLWTELALAEVR